MKNMLKMTICTLSFLALVIASVPQTFAAEEPTQEAPQETKKSASETAAKTVTNADVAYKIKLLESAIANLKNEIAKMNRNDLFVQMNNLNNEVKALRNEVSQFLAIAKREEKDKKYIIDNINKLQQYQFGKEQREGLKKLFAGIL